MDQDIINYCKDKVRQSLLTEWTARILNLSSGLFILINHLVQFLDLSTVYKSVELWVDCWSFTWQAVLRLDWPVDLFVIKWVSSSSNAYIQEVCGSDLVWDIDNAEVFCDFPQSLPENTKPVSWLGHDYILSYLFIDCPTIFWCYTP
jgi:hypothetical protein